MYFCTELYNLYKLLAIMNYPDEQTHWLTTINCYELKEDCLVKVIYDVCLSDQRLLLLSFTLIINNYTYLQM